jgi:hypothetical protein
MRKDKLESLKSKKQQLQNQVSFMSSKKRELRRKVLLGELLMDWINSDHKLRDRVREELDERLHDKLDRELFGLTPAAGKQSTGAQA